MSRCLSDVKTITGDNDMTSTHEMFVIFFESIEDS